MVKIALILVFVSCLQFTFSQTYIVQVKPDKAADLWGYADQNGNILIEPKYRKCSEFSEEGFATIYDMEKKEYSFIDRKGNTVPVGVKKFTMVKSFSLGIPVSFQDGLVPISKSEGKKWGYLGVNGEMAIPEKYEDAGNFHDGHAVARIGDRYYIINADLSETPVIDKSIVKVRKMINKMAPFEGKDGNIGFIDATAKIVVPAKFRNVGYFRGDLAWAKLADGKGGYINTKGEWVIQPTFEGVKDFDPISGLAKVKKEGVWGFVNTTGEFMTFTDAEDFGDFSEGLCWARKGKLHGFINGKFEWVIAPQYIRVKDFTNGYAIFKEGEKWGIIDSKGTVTCSPKFDDMKDILVKIK